MTHSNWNAKITDEMSTEALTVHPTMSLREAAQLLQEKRITGVPVVNEVGRAIGVVSQTDLLRRVVETGKLEGVVDDVMTALALSLPADASVARAAAVMATEGIHRLPVLSEDGLLVGIASTMDVVRWVARNEGLLPQE